VGYILCAVYIGPDEFGIKQVNIGIKKGIRPKVYHTGLHFVMPFGMEFMHKFPKDVQVLELTSEEKQRLPFVRLERAAHIQTSDGFFVDVDASILYHIEDPYKIITTVGPGRLYETNGIIPKAEPILKEALGKLTTEEFYNSPLRVEKTQIACEALNKELNPKGIKVDHVLIRYFKYSPEIQKNIEEKKLKDQLVFKNQAEARAAAEEAKLKKTIEEGEAAVAVKLQEGEAYVTKKNAERDLYTRKRKAEADLLVKLAEAKRIELKNKALQGAGSDRMVGLKMAEVYEGLDVIILPSSGEGGVNPLDMNKTLRLFGVRRR
jgi:regulator of protease activity HflC (stomatin/prohibitin superfamily)